MQTLQDVFHQVKELLLIDDGFLGGKNLAHLTYILQWCLAAFMKFLVAFHILRKLCLIWNRSKSKPSFWMIREERWASHLNDTEADVEKNPKEVENCVRNSETKFVTTTNAWLHQQKSSHANIFLAHKFAIANRICYSHGVKIVWKVLHPVYERRYHWNAGRWKLSFSALCFRPIYQWNWPVWRQT